MRYQVGDEIHFWLDGIISQGKILNVGVLTDTYAVQFQDPSGITWVLSVSDPDVVGKVGGRQLDKCTCGSEKLKHPGHSHWCDKEKWK